MFKYSSRVGFVSKSVTVKWWIILVLACKFILSIAVEADETIYDDDLVKCRPSCVETDPHGLLCRKMDTPTVSCIKCDLPSCDTVYQKQQQLYTLLKQSRLKGNLSTVEVKVLLDSMELPQEIKSKVDLQNITTVDALEEVVASALWDCVTRTGVDWSVDTRFPLTSTYARFEAILKVTASICGYKINPRFTGDVTVYFISRTVVGRINGVEFGKWNLSSRRRMLEGNSTYVVQGNTTILPLNTIRRCVGVPGLSLNFLWGRVGISACASLGLWASASLVTASFSAHPRAEIKLPFVSSFGEDLAPSWSRDARLVIYTFNWVTFSWTQCSASCKQTRSVICRRSDGMTVSDSLCTGNKPSTSQVCTWGSCTTTWSVGFWSSCSTSCRQTRSVICRRSDGETVSDWSCSGSKPSTTRNCTGGDCPTVSQPPMPSPTLSPPPILPPPPPTPPLPAPPSSPTSPPPPPGSPPPPMTNPLVYEFSPYESIGANWQLGLGCGPSGKCNSSEPAYFECELEIPNKLNLLKNTIAFELGDDTYGLSVGFDHKKRLFGRVGKGTGQKKRKTAIAMIASKKIPDFKGKIGRLGFQVERVLLGKSYGWSIRLYWNGLALAQEAVSSSEDSWSNNDEGGYLTGYGNLTQDPWNEYPKPFPYSSKNSVLKYVRLQDMEY